MVISLNNISPIPLRDRLAQRKSDIWNTSCTFNEGERIKIKAPSGTGKTTFIHILYKLRTDYTGNVTWNNEDIKNIRAEKLAAYRQQNISVIFQDMRLFDNLSIKENLELKRVMSKPLYEASYIDEMAAQLGITHILNQRAGLCSYGEQQRAAIIRALIQPFNWLFMDEPFSHLDNNNTKLAASLIESECIKRNAGFILTDLDDDDNLSYTKKLSL